MDNKLAYWEGKKYLSSSFCRPDHLSELWNKLKRTRVVQDDNGNSNLLQDTAASNAGLQWSSMSSQELCDLLQEQHKTRGYFLTRLFACLWECLCECLCECL